MGNSRSFLVGALFATAALGACTMDFDTLVAKTTSGGTGGTGGGAGVAGAGGSSGAGGSDDAGNTDTGGGAGGAAGAAGASGTGGSDGGQGGNVDAGRGDAPGDGGRADGGKGGADAATDRRGDAVADVRSEGGFDCAAVSGTVYQGHCYYPIPTAMTWDAARAACAAPAHLATITTAGEQNVVANIQPNADRWIGMRKDPGPPNQESRFYWVTMEVVSYRLWDSYETGAPEPNFTGDCVRMRPTNAWGDNPCTDPHVAVCEYE